MGWVEPLQGAVVGLETAPLIYYIEAHPTYVQRLDPFFDALDRGELTVVISFITLLEFSSIHSNAAILSWPSGTAAYSWIPGA